MSQPDSFIPLYCNEFFQAVEGQPDHVALGYLRALWHYWHHENCKGLKNEPEYLRRICRVERDVWPETFPVIFGEYFRLGDGEMWQQKRAREVWFEAERRYKLKVEQTKAATAARWKGKR